jgi:hypothetical protein
VFPYISATKDVINSGRSSHMGIRFSTIRVVASYQIDELQSANDGC